MEQPVTAPMKAVKFQWSEHQMEHAVFKRKTPGIENRRLRRNRPEESQLILEDHQVMRAIGKQSTLKSFRGKGANLPLPLLSTK